MWLNKLLILNILRCIQDTLCIKTIMSNIYDDACEIIFFLFIKLKDRGSSGHWSDRTCYNIILGTRVF